MFGHTFPAAGRIWILYPIKRAVTARMNKTSLPRSGREVLAKGEECKKLIQTELGRGFVGTTYAPALPDILKYPDCGYEKSGPTIPAATVTAQSVIRRKQWIDAQKVGFLNIGYSHVVFRRGQQLGRYFFEQLPAGCRLL